MNNSNNLLASVSLFAELYDNNKDIKEVLKEFILSLFTLEKIYSIDSIKAQTLLNNHYGFEIPEAVVVTTLNNLKKSKILSKSKGEYHLVFGINENKNLIQGVENNLKEQESIYVELIQYVLNIKKNINESEKSIIRRSLNQYLLGGKYIDDYYPIIAAFILKNTNNLKFQETLDEITEGLILYNGLSYSNSFNELEEWNHSLTFYLDTEHLFNCNGYNGTVFQQLFYDFFDLIRDANKRIKDDSKKINVRFFQNTKLEIEKFFNVAELIFEKKLSRNPNKTAMTEILNGCVNKSDIINKKSDFFDRLKTMGIKEEKLEFDPTEYPQYNVGNESILEKYTAKNEDFKHEENLLTIFEIFSKINFLRKGDSRKRFEEIGSIFLTGKILTLKMSFDPDIQIKQRDIPFSTDIYYTTNRLWLKLNRGFKSEKGLPTSLKAITKAKVILSSQINNSITEKYEKLQSEFERGEISKDKAQSRYYHLRTFSLSPEEFDEESVDGAIDFILDDDFDKFVREKSQLEKEAKKSKTLEIQVKNEKLEKEEANKLLVLEKRRAEETEKKLKKLEFNNRKNIKNNIKKKLIIRYKLIVTIICFIFITILVYLGQVLYKLISPEDSMFGIISGIASILGILGLIKVSKIAKIINSYLIINLKREYLQKIKEQILTH